jgi:thiamine-phosphate diphosphorylase
MPNAMPTTPLPERLAPIPAPAGVIPVLHAVTTDEIVMRRDFLETARRVMVCGGPRLALHLRAPFLDGATLHDIAMLLSAAQDDSGAWLIVHDRVDVAGASGARGVQLTTRSLRPGAVRRIAPSLFVGASAHTVEDVLRAGAEGAHWVVLDKVLSGFAASGLKTTVSPYVERAARAASVPIIALGSVAPEHVGALRDAGVYGVASIRGIWDSTNAEGAASRYLSAHDAGGRG